MCNPSASESLHDAMRQTLRALPTERLYHHGLEIGLSARTSRRPPVFPPLAHLPQYVFTDGVDGILSQICVHEAGHAAMEHYLGADVYELNIVLRDGVMIGGNARFAVLPSNFDRQAWQWVYAAGYLSTLLVWGQDMDVGGISKDLENILIHDLHANEVVQTSTQLLHDVMLRHTSDALLDTIIKLLPTTLTLAQAFYDRVLLGHHSLPMQEIRAILGPPKHVLVFEKFAEIA
jgi:hypothetical protein